MDLKMATRNFGVLDSFFASYVTPSKLSKKAQTYTISGSNPDVDTNTEEDVINFGGRYPYISTAERLTITSSSANDIVGGSGLEYVNLIGLDANWDIQTELVPLNGVTGVLTGKDWRRVFVMAGSKPGAVDPNTKASGIIQAVFTASVQAQINAGRSASGMAIFTVPRGFTGFLDQTIISGGANDDFIISFEVRKPGDIFVARSDFEITNSNVHDIQLSPKIGNVTEMSDIKLSTQAVSVNAQVRCIYTVTIVENKYLQSLAKSI